MTEGEVRCPVCNGSGYLHCDCWPGDCICGQDDRNCENCFGSGWIDWDDDWDHGAPTIRPRAAATNIGE